MLYNNSQPSFLNKKQVDLVKTLTLKYQRYIKDNCLSKSSGVELKESILLILLSRRYPLSIVLVRVGDGPWEDMKSFGLGARECHNFNVLQ